MMIPEKSAMAKTQRMNILSNDLVRRVSNVKLEQAEEGEVLRIVDQYTGQLKTSGYGRKKCREIVIAGLVGWKRKRSRRLEKGGGFYRGAASTLGTRIRKKLLDKVTWYKPKMEEGVKGIQDREEARGKKRKAEEVKGKIKKRKKEGEAKAVMFCPYTRGGELAKQLREAEGRLEPMTGFRIKVVEEVGEKIKDILHSSNPWRGEDCKREGCWLCRTKLMMDKRKQQDCMKRNLVYETWCETCRSREEKQIEEDEEASEEEKEKRRKGIKMHKYVGETARSVYERGMEHLNGLQSMKEDNHLMKHVAMFHQDMEVEEVKFGIMVVKYTRSA